MKCKTPFPPRCRPTSMPPCQLFLLLSCLLPVDCSSRTSSPSHLLKLPHTHRRTQPQSHSPTRPHSIRRSLPKTTRIPKSVSDIGCIPTDGTAYTGNASTTESGLACQVWSVNTPHEHSYNGVGEHNYCRGLDGYALWCYTTDPGKEWEYCDVPFCMTYTKGI